MKMFKKLMAVVLTGVMAISMLTGCAVTDKFVENAARDALKDISDASFSVSSKKEDTDATKDARKVMVEWAKKEDNKKTAPTQAIVNQVLNNNANSNYYYVLIDYSTSKATVKGSIDTNIRTVLSTLDKNVKVKFTVSESFSAAKKNGSTDKKDYALIVFCDVQDKSAN